MGRQTSGIYEDAKNGKWKVDKTHRGQRLQGRFESYSGAEDWLIARCGEIDATGPIRSESMSFAQAVTRYMLDAEEKEAKVSLQTETYLIAPVLDFIGTLPIAQVHSGTLKPFVEARLAAGRAHKTINLALGVVRAVLKAAHTEWMVATPTGGVKPLLERMPVLSMLPLIGHQREPAPISWEQQRALMPLLPPHLSRMALFVLNTGVRDNVVVSLRWEWEIQLELDGQEISVFEIPRPNVKGRKQVRYVVCNSVAKSVVDSVRGQHAEFVFVYRRERVKNLDQAPTMPYQPINSMTNTAWDNATAKAGIDVHVHDLRHTVGMRLRESAVAEATISDVLWHARQGITAHYSTAQVREIWDALERIKNETGQQNRSLRSLAKEQRASKVPSGTTKVPSVTTLRMPLKHVEKEAKNTAFQNLSPFGVPSAKKMG